MIPIVTPDEMTAIDRAAPEQVEVLIGRAGAAVARAALDAQEFGTAREALKPLLREPTQSVAALMAEIERRESGDEGRAREWMARALRAPRDFYYFCLANLALVSLGAWWLIRSPWGRAFVALRENPVRALSLGIDTAWKGFRLESPIARAVGATADEDEGGRRASWARAREADADGRR